MKQILDIFENLLMLGNTALLYTKTEIAQLHAVASSGKVGLRSRNIHLYEKDNKISL